MVNAGSILALVALAWPIWVGACWLFRSDDRTGATSDSNKQGVREPWP